MSRPVAWGILGAGRIAHHFARDLRRLPDARLAAVGSRSGDRAHQFAARHEIPSAHQGYEALVADPGVDIVYVATPHPMHHSACLLALAAGKAVLCEKPLTLNARQAREVIAAARHRRRFLMEGMWSRFFPAVTRLRRVLAEGTIGQVRALQACFGFRARDDPADRLLNPALGGGSVLDVGIYPVALASLVFGRPTTIQACAHIGPTGVDEQCAILLGYDGGALASLACAVRTAMPPDAVVLGTRGEIRVGTPFWRPDRLTLVRTPDPDSPPEPGGRWRAVVGRTAHRIGAGAARFPRLSGWLEPAWRGIASGVDRLASTRRYRFPYRGHGFHYEIAEVHRCLRAGRVESPAMPLDESLTIVETLDRIRQQIGLSYPME